MEQTTEKEELKEKEIIADNEKRFEFFVHFPKVVTIILGIIVFAAGIFVGSNGVGSFAPTLIIWLGGALLCWWTHDLLKLSFSYQILNIYYLRQIVRQKEERDKMGNADLWHKN